MKPATFQWMIHGICATAMLAVVTVAYAIVFRPISSESTELGASIDNRTEFLAGAEEILSRNSELKKNLAEAEELTDRIKRRIPDAPQVGDFLAQIADAAEKSHVELVDYRPAAAVEKENHHELTISVSANGDYAAICRFLDRIQTLPRLCHITAMEIEAGDLNAITYPFELKLQVFYSRTRTDVAQNEGDSNG